MNTKDRLLSDEQLENLLFDFVKAVSYKQMAVNPNIKGFYQMDNKASIDVGGVIKSLVAEINTQKCLYAESERYNWVVKGAETVIEDLSDWIKANNPNVNDIQHRISTITGHIELKKLDKKIEDELRAEQRARIK